MTAARVLLSDDSGTGRRRAKLSVVEDGREVDRSTVGAASAAQAVRGAGGPLDR